MMTPIARKIARSRAGNADPSFMTSGRVNTPASVMAPRTPAKDIAARILQSGSEREPPLLARVRRNEIQTHVNLSTARPSVTRTRVAKGKGGSDRFVIGRGRTIKKQNKIKKKTN